ncbi:hypothetical protein GCK32_004881 [Trichostrongylus colubriformis]|uniref:Rabphilin n=1 Tax=Trichostrongylus colubriformis TaxID=6319 RepID=A0AAN8ETC7_TRICO
MCGRGLRRSPQGSSSPYDLGSTIESDRPPQLDVVPADTIAMAGMSGADDTSRAILLNLDLPTVSNRSIKMQGAQDMLTSSLFIVRKLSQAFFNAQHGEHVGNGEIGDACLLKGNIHTQGACELSGYEYWIHTKLDLMNDWEIGGTQNKWVCPSDRHLHLRAQLKSGWSVRTATARSPTNSKGNSGITEAEQEHIRQVLAKAEESRLKEQQRLGKMVDRLEKMRRRATGNGVTHCLLCHTEFGLLASKSYAAMCVDCRKYVCQRNCGVETLDTQHGEVIFLCKICSEAREVLWKKSGAWFYKEVPEFVRPEANGSVMSPPLQHRPSWTSPAGSSTSQPYPRRHLPPTPNDSELATPAVLPDILIRTKSPRPRIQPSWVKEKVMTSMSVDDDDRSSSEGEFAQSGVVRRSHKATMAARQEESSPDSRASTSRASTSPRRSLATPSSYDSTHNQTAPPTLHDDARSIDSGVVQSDHSNPQQAMTLSVSSLAPFSSPVIEAPLPRRVSQTEMPPDVTKVTASLSRTSLTTPPPIPPRSPAPTTTETRRSSPAPSTQGTQSPTASFMSSPDDDTTLQAADEMCADLDHKSVIILKLQNLKAMDSNGFSDPYVKLHLLPGNAKATKLTSRTIEKTLNPEWNEELHYYGVTEADKQKKTLRITVLDRDRIGSDFLGETRIALRKLPIQQPRQETDVIRGKILVALQYNIQQGSLFVTIKRCVELIGMDSTGFSDPYCKISLTPITSKAHRQRTSIKKRTLNPEFNETITFVVPFKDLPKKTLQIGVYDHDLGKHDDYIGGIVLSTAAKDERGRQWSSCIENPGQTFESWHQLELDG